MKKRIMELCYAGMEGKHASYLLNLVILYDIKLILNGIHVQDTAGQI